MMALPLSPLVTVLLLTAGIALAYVELNRPGLILPGAAGLLATLLAFASISKTVHGGLTILLLLAGFTLLYLDDRHPRIVFAMLAGFLLLLAFRILNISPALVLRLTTIACAVGIAFGSHVLNRIAYQARVNKGAAKPLKSTSKQVN